MVTNLFIYPVKSTFRIPLKESEIEYEGLKNDRTFAIVNNKGKIITAREHKNLFKIKTTIENYQLIFQADGHEKYEYSLFKKEVVEKEVIIFNDEVNVKIVDDEINDWLSKIIGESAQLVMINEDKRRKMKPKFNGKENDYIGFQDASAIHLISESSLAALNKNLEIPVTMHHFRPNIVIKGNVAYEEDNWEKVKIGACEFEVAVKTGRCSMLTVNPDTQLIDKHKEPLKTLTKLRSEKNRVHFGIYLIPRKIGTIKIMDEIVII